MQPLDIDNGKDQPRQTIETSLTRRRRPGLPAFDNFPGQSEEQYGGRTSLTCAVAVVPSANSYQAEVPSVLLISEGWSSTKMTQISRLERKVMRTSRVQVAAIEKAELQVKQSRVV